MFARDKHSNVLRKFVNYDRKRFDDIVTTTNFPHSVIFVIFVGKDGAYPSGAPYGTSL